MRIKFTYFNQSGKYYSEGEREVPGRYDWEVYQNALRLLRSGDWPGLIGPDDFSVLLSADDDFVPALFTKQRLDE